MLHDFTCQRRLQVESVNLYVLAKVKKVSIVISGFFSLKGDILTDLTCSVCSEGHINWVKVYGGCVVLDGFFKIFRLVGCISLFLCL